jgi:hypothetical protein
MKNRTKILSCLAVVLTALFIAVPVMANTTVSGEVGDAGEIIANDGTIYTIAATEKGDELASMIGETVNVTGTVEEAEGEKIITVESFTVVKK